MTVSSVIPGGRNGAEILQWQGYRGIARQRKVLPTRSVAVINRAKRRPGIYEQNGAEPPVMARARDTGPAIRKSKGETRPAVHKGNNPEKCAQKMPCCLKKGRLYCKTVVQAAEQNTVLRCKNMKLHAMLYGTCLCMLLFITTSQAQDIQVEKVIGTEHKGGYKHPATITQLQNGDLYIAYYGGSGEYQNDSKVWGLRKPAWADKWSEPQVLADTPFRDEGNPVIWQAPDGLVWLFYVQRYGDTWSDSRIKAKISRDGARTWSDSFMVAFEQGMMVQGLPTLLRDGDYLLPVYHETGHNREKLAPTTSSLFLRINPRTMDMTFTNKITSKYGNLQPHAVQITDKYLVAYCRRGGSYDPIPDGRIVRSESHDGGRTWSAGTESSFPNPNAGIDFIRLKNGHLMLVYNDSIAERNPLAVAISTDNDKSYAYKRIIASTPDPSKQTFAYPVAIQTRDGRIHVVCTTDSRKTILHFTFDESAILSHKWKK